MKSFYQYNFILKNSKFPPIFVLYRRFYRNHFTDSVRQCCLDLMQGCAIVDSDIQDFWSYLRTVGNITGELIPIGTPQPSYVPHVALTQEFELANALYYMCRSVKDISTKKHRSVKIYCV